VKWRYGIGNTSRARKPVGFPATMTLRVRLSTLSERT